MRRVRTISARLYELAEAHDGYVTAADAAAEGISRPMLAFHTDQGTLIRISRGVYRLKRFPVLSPNTHLWEAVLWPSSHREVVGVLSHRTALVLHELSDVNPNFVEITIPLKITVRRTTPSSLRIHRATLEPFDVVHVDSLPTTSIDRTLRDIAGQDDVVTLHAALRDARAKGIAIPRELLHV